MKKKIDQYIKHFKRSLNKDIKNELKLLKYKQKTNNKLKKVKKQLKTEGKTGDIVFFKNVINLAEKVFIKIKKQIPVILNNTIRIIKKCFSFIAEKLSVFKTFLKNHKPDFKKILKSLHNRKYYIFGLSCFIFLFLNLTIIDIDSSTLFEREVQCASGYCVFIDNGISKFFW